MPFCYKENGVVKSQRLIGVFMEFDEKTLKLIQDENTRWCLRIGKKITLVLLNKEKPTAIIMKMEYKKEADAVAFENKFRELRGGI